METVPGETVSGKSALPFPCLPPCLLPARACALPCGSSGVSIALPGRICCPRSIVFGQIDALGLMSFQGVSATSGYALLSGCFRPTPGRKCAR